MKNIEKIQRIYKSIQNIDEQIVQAEKMALQLVNKENIIHITIQAEDISYGGSVEEFKDSLDFYMSISPNPLESLYPTGLKKLTLGSFGEKKSNCTFKINSKIGLIFLEGIVNDLKSEREKLITELKKYVVC